MGCINSIFKKDKKDEKLINNYRCFVCGEIFQDNIEYNRHIPKCGGNLSSLNKNNIIIYNK